MRAGAHGREGAGQSCCYPQAERGRGCRSKNLLINTQHLLQFVILLAYIYIFIEISNIIYIYICIYIYIEMYVLLVKANSLRSLAYQAHTILV